jgi:RNA polymerase sigma factor (sigma-70 family)
LARARRRFDDGVSETQQTIRSIDGIESPKLIAHLTRLVRDVGRAEELAQDALVIALEQRPVSGVPDNPGAWLLTIATNRARNQLRRHKMLEHKHDQLQREHDALPELEARLRDDVDDVGDDLLRLVFIACHPVLSTDARVALMLRLLGGLTTAEIARAFLVSDPTIAQRIVRAKRTLADARGPFELRRGLDRSARLAAVLEVIYLIFNEGYAATASCAPRGARTRDASVEACRADAEPAGGARFIGVDGASRVACQRAPRANR